MATEYAEGSPHTVSPSREEDLEAAKRAEAESKLHEELQTQIMQSTFGDASVSPPRSRSSYTGRPSTGSSLRSQPYYREDVPRVDFYKRDGKEYQKSDLKCADGHIPIFSKKDIPFSLYSNTPSKACEHNGANQYLSWDSHKSKYCCESEPDANEKIMERSNRVIQNMLARVTIDASSYPFLNHAIVKYLKYYAIIHPETLDDERKKMIELKKTFMTRLTQESERKTFRMEQVKRTDKTSANDMWGTTFAKLTEPSEKEGGRTKSRKSKSRKSRKPKSRKSKRRC